MKLGDLKQLESELNNLTDTKSVSGSFGLEESKIGLASAEGLSQSTARTWDGFSKMGSDVPLPSAASSLLTDREKNKKKRIMLKRLEEWQRKGLLGSNSGGFSMDSSYEDVEDEYETVMEDKRKQESIKLQKHWFLTGINTIEFFNSMVNPFDLDLTGWGEKMSEDIDDDDEIFAELYEKYKGGKLAPEVSLILRVATSAILINMTNKMVSAATPGLSDVFRQSPDLMNAFMKATVDSLNTAGPGQTGASNATSSNPLASMAKDMFSQEFKPKQQGPPPAPLETKKMAMPPRPGTTTQFTSSRPDLRGAVGGLDINEGFGSVQEKTMLRPSEPPSNFSPQNKSMEPLRPDMKGPSTTDLDAILAGLKRKENDADQPSNKVSFSSMDDEVSVISMRDLENGGGYKKKSSKKSRPRTSERSLSIDL
jgi:hypothetical protein